MIELAPAGYSGLLTVVAATVFLGNLARYTIGFGDALIIMPILSIFWGVQDAAVIVALMQLTVSAISLLVRRRHTRVQAAMRLVVGCVAGIPIGIYFLQTLPEQLILTILGVTMILYGLYACFTPRLPQLSTDRLGYLFGFLSGLFGGAYNINGPALVIYGTLRRWTQEQFLATVHGVFVPSTILVAAGHAFTGMWNPLNLTAFLFTLPLLALAMAIGTWLSRHIDTARFVNSINILIVLLGASVLVRALSLSA